MTNSENLSFVNWRRLQEGKPHTYKGHRQRKNEGRKARIKKSKIRARDGCRCNHCKKPFRFKELTVDHILPLVRGGESTIDNLQLLCNPCHREKSAREQAEFGPGRKEEGLDYNALCARHKLMERRGDLTSL